MSALSETRDFYETNAEAQREFLLKAVLCARSRAQLMVSEIDEVGIALRLRMIEPEFAVEWLSNINALQFLTRDPLREARQ